MIRGEDMSREAMTAGEVRRGIVKWIAQAAVGVVGYAAVIFISAGTLHWVWGWALVIVLAVVLIAHPLILIPINPQLLAERQRGMRDEGVKMWDQRITMLSGGLMFLLWIVAGLDYRWGWSPPLPAAVHLAGLLFVVVGYGLFLWAMASNAFFSEGVRIQTERGHTVASGGPYRYVRHPGYVGVIVVHTATPFLLGSLWALIPGLLLAGLFVLRTHLEDKTLTAELPGYEAYRQETPYRLLPGLW
ncbi:MAG: methyltransferase family protein [Candidatus Promineifilaceae bacterium]